MPPWPLDPFERPPHGGLSCGLCPCVSRPGGNVTGISVVGEILAAKRLELLRELIPGATLFAVLTNPKSPFTAFETKQLQAAAAILGARLLFVNAAGPGELDSAFSTIVEQRAAGLLVSADVLFLYFLEDQLIGLAARYKVPTIYLFRTAAFAGGLLSYGANLSEACGLTANYVSRILKGEKPADLPVQQSARFEMILNLKTAKALGLEVPNATLLRADQVIE